MNTTRRRLSPSSIGLAASLLLPACQVGPGIIGDATDTDTGTESNTEGADGTGSECTDDCDGELAVAAFGAPNFESQAVILWGSDTCDGPSCPTEVTPPPHAPPMPAPALPDQRCLDTEAALSSAVGPEEYCRFAAHLAFGLYLGMEGPLDRSSYEQTRPRLDDPSQEEGYLWHPEVIRIEGPGTAFRGDYYAGSAGQIDTVTTLINETCAARLSALGIAWTEAELEQACQGTWDDGGQLRPLRMDPAMTFTSFSGTLRTDSGNSCDTPEAGPDGCCSSCDYTLGVRVAPYGVDGAGTRRQVEQNTAIACDPAGDPLIECRDLVLDVDRSEQEVSYTYAWDGVEQSWRVPWYDKVRETHPDDRPAAVEVVGPACTTASDCDDGLACIGTNASGQACTLGDQCQDRQCRAPWFGTCEAEPGQPAVCRDARFDPRGAASCLRSTVDFGAGSAGDRLASCDANGDGILSAAECCDPALGGAAGCDPFGQPNLEPVPRYDRHPELGEGAQCACSEGEPLTCGEVLDAWCEAPLGTASDPGPASPNGGYAVPLVTRSGGLRAESSEGWLRMRIADLGNISRGDVEACAESRGRIAERTVADGWLANEPFAPELFEDHDLAMCSGSTYRVILAESDAEHHLRTPGGNALDGRSEHVFETSQFRMVPDSLFPTDNLTIGACDNFSVTFSAKYDLGLTNLRKVELHEGSADGPLVAGGSSCDPEASPAEVATGVIPCLSVDVDNRFIGELRFHIDRDVHGQVLVPGTTYAVVVPGLDEVAQMADADAYAAAFHDACGMPLILGSTPEVRALSEASFTVDDPCL